MEVFCIGVEKYAGEIPRVSVQPPARLHEVQEHQPAKQVNREGVTIRRVIGPMPPRVGDLSHYTPHILEERAPYTSPLQRAERQEHRDLRRLSLAERGQRLQRALVLLPRTNATPLCSIRSSDAELEPSPTATERGREPGYALTRGQPQRPLHLQALTAVYSPQQKQRAGISRVQQQPVFVSPRAFIPRQSPGDWRCTVAQRAQDLDQLGLALRGGQSLKVA
jgi:hypothetical protein